MYGFSIVISIDSLIIIKLEFKRVKTPCWTLPGPLKGIVGVYNVACTPFGLAQYYRYYMKGLRGLIVLIPPRHPKLVRDLRPQRHVTLQIPP